MSAAPPKVRIVKLELPEKLGFLMDMHRYKVVYGGRGGGKSWSYADTLLTLGAGERLRILCAREIQRSIKDSVLKLLADRIEALGLGSFYQVLETEIRGRNGTEFIFTGLAGHTVESIKSYEGIDVVWVEEAQTVQKRSWDILIPTIRAENSEIWISFNPDMDTDETWVRFIANPPPGAVVVKMNYSDNPWFPSVLEQERLHCQKTAPDDYDNIWEGKCRTVVAGAIYAREVIAMVEEGRIRPIPYDPRLPVHTIWDLGWNDAMTIIMVQKPVPSALNIINYMEDSFRTYAEFVADLNALRYTWGTDWLPHDGANKDPKSGTSAKAMLEGFGRKVKIIDRSDPEARIKAARMMFPRIYIDASERKRATGYLGAARLIDCLKRYCRTIPRSTGEPATPKHDEFSHAADAFGGLAEIVDQIRNDGDIQPPPTLPAFTQSDPTMGCL